MKRITQRSLLPLCLLAAASLPACQVRVVPESDYLKQYEDNFTGVALPSSTDILKDGMTQSFQSPADEVWQECLRIAAQKQGVLAVDSGTGGNSPRRLLILDGQHLLVFQTSSQGGYDVSTFMDTWLAITIVPQGPESCQVGVAWVNPQTNKVAPFPPVREAEAWTISVAQMHPFFKSSAIRKERRFVAQVQAAEFLQDIGIQMYGPGQWLARLKGPSPAPRGAPPAVKLREDPGYPEIKNDYGNWCSLVLRKNTCIVACPELENELTRILNDIKRAAGKQDMQTRVYVLATNETNAFSLPNGDIFLCSGLMDILSDANQAAAVLAHELDHYAQHDAVYKIQNEFRVKVAVITVAIAASVAGSAIGSAMQTSATLSNSLSPSTQFISELLQEETGQAALAAGSSVHDTIVTGYSWEIELRADNNGMRYMWAAGYDPQGMMQLMGKLKSVEVAARDARAFTGSHLVNCKPGIEKRTEELQNVLKELSNSP